MTNTPQDPEVTDKSYASALSFVGITRRFAAWGDRHSSDNTALNVLVETGVVLGLMLMYSVVLVWYTLMVANLLAAGVFIAFCGATVILIPFIPVGMVWLFSGLAVFGLRSHRRGQRKAQHVQEVQLATMQAMHDKMNRRDDNR